MTTATVKTHVQHICHLSLSTQSNMKWNVSCITTDMTTPVAQTLHYSVIKGFPDNLFEG